MSSLMNKRTPPPLLLLSNLNGLEQAGIRNWFAGKEDFNLLLVRRVIEPFPDALQNRCSCKLHKTQRKVPVSESLLFYTPWKKKKIFGSEFFCVWEFCDMRHSEHNSLSICISHFSFIYLKNPFPNHTGVYASKHRSLNVSLDLG